MGVNVIWWIRRDLRLHDNPALQAALASKRGVIPLFILDDRLIHSPSTSERRLGFLWSSLTNLNMDLHSRGSQLIVRHAPPLKALQSIMAQYDIERIFAEADFSPYARKRDSQVAQKLPLELVGGSSISHPDAVLKSNGEPYIVYSPYMRTWKAVHHPEEWKIIPVPTQISFFGEIGSDAIPSTNVSQSMQFKPSEAAARERLVSFFSGSDPTIYEYQAGRNRVDLEGTAGISPYLRFGMLSAREAAHKAALAIQSAPNSKARYGAETWLNELIWRDFYISILYHFPHVLKQGFRKEFRDIHWRSDLKDFDAWRQGQTGYPIVDAAMRQLTETGWMHNRVRMITASFLVKNLLIDWRWGERWFRQQLLDGDPAANNGGWQWIAGTGTDAAPYFRIFNPILQSKKSDPQGTYIRRWVPELTRIPLKYIHTPWLLPADEQKKLGFTIGLDYPEPIVDHTFARQRSLETYNAQRDKSRQHH